MEKSQKPKDIIIQILDIAGYGENKEEFADQLLSLCQQQTFVDLIKKLPVEKQAFLEKSNSLQPNPQQLDQFIKENYTEGEILEALKKATQNTIQAYLQTISPHLSDTQKKNLQTFVQALTQ